MVSLKIPDGQKIGEDFIYITDQDAMLILVNVANQLAMNHFSERELMGEDESDDELLPPFPGG